MSYLETLRQAMKETSNTGGVSEKGPERSLVENELNESNEIRGNGPKIPTLKPSGHASLFDLPFPLGYRGLPDRAVRAALAWCDAKEVTDPMETMLEVCWWVLDHLKQRKYRGPLYQKVRVRARELWTDLTGVDDDPYCDECPGQLNAL